MSNLSKALKEFISENNHPTLVNFVIDNKRVVKVWIFYYATLEDATISLKNKMKAIYKQIHPKRTTMPNVNVDLTELFAEAKTDGIVAVEGNRTLAASTQSASRRIVNELKETSDNRSDMNTNATDAAADVGRRTETEEQTPDHDIHEILSLSHILLLNHNQHGKALVDIIGLENLDLYLNQLKATYLGDATVSDTTFAKLTNTFRNLETKSRTAIKLELMTLALDSNNDEFDLHIITVLLNCVQKLPKYNIDEPIGEHHLITNYIDPILNPIFHHPDHGRLFHWLNRSMEDTEALRPDGCMYITQQRHTQYAIGYCEVMAHDNEDNVDCVHRDLYRMAMFCKNSLNRGHIKALMAIQVVGETMIYYLFTMESDMNYVMFELGRLNAPLTYDQLPQFIMKLDFLKRISTTYYTNCIRRIDDSVVGLKRHSLDKNTLDEMINPGSPTKKKTKSALQFH
ncbi:unnamed protein product [Absidia cylindrospora]